MNWSRWRNPEPPKVGEQERGSAQSPHDFYLSFLRKQGYWAKDTRPDDDGCTTIYFKFKGTEFQIAVEPEEPAYFNVLHLIKNTPATIDEITAAEICNNLNASWKVAKAFYVPDQALFLASTACFLGSRDDFPLIFERMLSNLNALRSELSSRIERSQKSPLTRIERAEEKSVSVQPEATVQDAKMRVATICDDIREAAHQSANDGHPIWDTKGLQQFVSTLGSSLANLVYAIMAPGEVAAYRELWKADVEVFLDLAGFLGYYLTIHGVPKSDDRDDKLDIVLPVIAAIYSPSDRVQASIGTYHELMTNPQEMKDRHILHVYQGSSDDSARAVIYEYIVNDLINGPDLGGQPGDPQRIDPRDSLMLKLQLHHHLIEHLKVVQEAGLLL